jgi:N-formylglutamate amidohydrolase
MWTIEYQETNLVSRHRGTLPVILTCPHNGLQKPEDVPERTGGPEDCPRPSLNADLNTRDITTRVAQRLLDVFGEAPSVVVAAFHRKYIDVNRADLPLNCAYEVPAAKQYYDEYHNTVRGFVDEIRAENGGIGFLFDVHGTRVIAGDPADFYLGTDNGRTIARLLSVDPQALWRRRGIRGFLGLDAAGYVISPKQPDVEENKAVDGGHTVRTYGSSAPNGIDAIQLEIASILRNDKDKRNALIDNLAFAIGNMVARYLDLHTSPALQDALSISH